MKSGDFMEFRESKLGKDHPRWFTRIPAIHRFMGAIKEEEKSKQLAIGKKVGGKTYELHSMIFPLLAATIGQRNDLVEEMFNFITKKHQITEEDLRTVNLSAPLLNSVFVAHVLWKTQVNFTWEGSSYELLFPQLDDIADKNNMVSSEEANSHGPRVKRSDRPSSCVGTSERGPDGREERRRHFFYGGGLFFGISYRWWMPEGGTYAFRVRNRLDAARREAEVVYDR